MKNLNCDEITEIWKDVKDYEGIYQVSNLGRIRSIDRIKVYKDGRLFKLKGKIIKQVKNHKGYLTASLCNGKCKTVIIHRIVANAFIPNSDNKPQVNHIDGNKENNRINNLEWSTQYENMQHSVDMNLKYTKRVKCVETNEVFNSVRRAARAFNACHKDISECCHKRKNTCKGNHFIFI